MSDQKPREFWISYDKVVADFVSVSTQQITKNETYEIINVIEKNAYDDLEIACKLREQIDGECIGSLQQDIEKLRADLDLAIEALSDTSSWLHRMSDLKWNDKSYAPKFKAAYIRMTEILAKLQERK